jgi:hypothetical protein
VGKLLGLAPFRWLGERTYGIYLFHMPVVAFMPASVLEGRPFARAGLQISLILSLSALSYALLEDPIRRNGLVATFTPRGGWRVARRWAGVALLVPFATAVLGAWPLVSDTSASEIDFETSSNEAEDEAPEVDPDPSPSDVAPASSIEPASLATARTSCNTLVHVGDSTSLALVSKKYLPHVEDRLEAQYRDVGVRVFVAEISGGRAIVEKFKNEQESAFEIVMSRSSGGYKGCWVLALGNGDAATVRGNLQALSQRIDWMMKAAAGAPVMWTTTKTLLERGPYRNAYMQSWNTALASACARHPNMRVYDWASELRDEWFLSDKIHPNAIGSKEKAARIANALTVAYPKDGAPSTECVVHSAM